MNTIQKLPEEKWKAVLWIGLGTAAVAVVLAGLFVVLMLGQMGAGAQVAPLLNWLLSADQSQLTWYITRSAGLTAYLLLWLSTVWGLAIPSKILDGFLHGAFTFEFHQFISLLAIGFLAAHIGVLLVDQYMPFSVVQLLLPFVSAYRPVWVGIGIISFYLILLVTITFYWKAKIGLKAFRAIHLLSLVSFVGAAAHGLFAGTDSLLPVVRILYAVTFVSVVFLTTYWMAVQAMKKRQPVRPVVTRRAS